MQRKFIPTRVFLLKEWRNIENSVGDKTCPFGLATIIVSFLSFKSLKAVQEDFFEKMPSSGIWLTLSTSRYP